MRVAWVPEQWVEAAEDVLAGLAERHPSRTIVLVPEPEADDGIEASVEVDCYPVGEDRKVSMETIRLKLCGRRMRAPASVVEPLLLPDLPVFLRWRGLPPFGEQPFEQLVDTVDRLIVDSTEWAGLPAPYARLVEIFDRVAVSDIAWARTSRWRMELASLWPGIADVRRIKVTGPRRRRISWPAGCDPGSGGDRLEHEEADRLRASRSTASRRRSRPGMHPRPPTS
jgi:glucose-6-phosphate dehydrogenase assembly protein OpcA